MSRNHNIWVNYLVGFGKSRPQSIILRDPTNQGELRFSKEKMTCYTGQKDLFLPSTITNETTDILEGLQSPLLLAAEPHALRNTVPTGSEIKAGFL